LLYPRFFFDTIDYDKKGHITLMEFKSFLDETSVLKKRSQIKEKDAVKNEMAENIYQKLRKSLEEAGLSFQKVLVELEIKENQFLNEKQLQRVFSRIGCVLMNSELQFFIDRIKQKVPEKTLNFQDFLDFCIKEGIEILNMAEDEVNYIHPAVSLFLNRIHNVFLSLDLTPKMAFQYLLKRKTFSNFLNFFFF
jgi:hypothetical protein